jgi:hypothetical protein
VTIPHQSTANPAPMSQDRWLVTIRQLLTEDELPPLTRGRRDSRYVLAIGLGLVVLPAATRSRASWAYSWID